MTTNLACILVNNNSIILLYYIFYGCTYILPVVLGNGLVLGRVTPSGNDDQFLAAMVIRQPNRMTILGQILLYMYAIIYESLYN